MRNETDIDRMFRVARAKPLYDRFDDIALKTICSHELENSGPRTGLFIVGNNTPDTVEFGKACNPDKW